ncbi:MAG: hypothetical protein DMG06_09730 [Acidobacteria bacterium]|nr:MAG: hypothetical protein DMG06_09730 [Acidobacteriota bacterium]
MKRSPPPFGRLFPFLFLGCFFNLIYPTPFPSVAETKDPESLLQTVEKLEFDLERVLTVRDLNLRRGPFSITFDRGRMIFLRPVENVVTGLYFWGNGTMVGIPPNKIERQQLNLFTGAPVLNERFQEAFIRFSDDAYRELIEQSEAYDNNVLELNVSSELFQGVLKASSLINYRIVADLMHGRRAPFFSAKMLGRKLSIFDFSYDERRAEDVNVGQFHKTAGRTFYDNWCSFSSRNLSGEGGETAQQDISGQDRSIDVLLYQVDTRIDKHDRINGSTDIQFRVEQEGEWLLTFDLSRFLKVTQVLDEQQRPLTFFQNGDMSSEEDISKLGHDVILVLLKDPLHRGQLKTLKFTYSGEVISRVGNGVFYVGSRGSWYPNVGNADRAKYVLKFQHPKPFTIVATGDLVKEWEEADQKHSLWQSKGELPVAGFNYGDYLKKTARAGAIPVEVYANRGIENVYLEVKARLEQLRELFLQRPGSSRIRGELLPDQISITPDLSDFDTTRFSDEIASQIVKALLFFEPFMGEYPFNKLAVSQIPGRFSQGWPSLLYVSSLSFMSPEQRRHLGMGTDHEAGFLECLHAHEIAHQWWGNQIGWKSYHDLWMFEGFSNYFGYLFMKEKHPDGKPFRELLRYSKEKILARNAVGQTYESAGPVWLGGRLSSSKFPEGYSTVIYDKGAWILHMLRYLMLDPSTGSDQNFRLFIQNFLTAFKGKLAATEDLKRMLEKKIDKGLDLEGNKKMDWFFSQWVYDTGIPTYRLEYSITALKNGGYQLKGKIKQQNVSEDFIMPVEVFGRFGPDKIERLGRVVVTGNEANFKFALRTKPLKVTLDENNEILCENKTL